jgi:pilus assembly protein Flp/PilA
MVKPTTAAKTFFLKGEEGASVVEYALLVALLLLVCLVAMASFGNSLSRLFSAAASSL